MDEKPQHLGGSRELEAAKFCFAGKTTSLIGSPNKSHQPAAGMSSAMGSDHSPERRVAALVSAAS